MLTSEEILQMKKVTDLICSAKKQIEYQIKVIFHLVFERDRHLMSTLYPPNVVKALEETILAAFLGTATGRLIPARCSALICQEYQSHGNYQGYGLLLVLLTGCSCVCCLGENQHTFLSVGSESPAVTPTYRTFYQSRICAATPKFPISTVSTVLVALLPPTLAERQTLSCS